jgi:methane monooxygenase component D
MTAFFNDLSSTSGELLDVSPEAIAIYTSNRYTAYSEDLDFMWRWRIYYDNNMVQEGCSLTLDASRRAVQHVLNFFNVAQLHT